MDLYDKGAMSIKCLDSPGIINSTAWSLPKHQLSYLCSIVGPDISATCLEAMQKMIGL